MYEAFFGLEECPFALTPDPRFLLRARRHHEVLSTLIHGVTSQKGLLALIGDVGTGKTVLCRALLRELPQDVQSALVLNPYLSDTELLRAIVDDLGAEHRGGGTKGELMETLSRYLLAAGADGKTVVIVLDEAQQLSREALEQIRILSTLETATRKLLQIALVGQPELEAVLKRPDLRQLDQRIAIRCHLEPLSKKETFRYIEHRLRIAGLVGPVPFSRGTLARIYRESRGVPRVVSLICDRALAAAFAARAREVTPGLAAAAIRNLRGDRGHDHERRGGFGARTLLPVAACVAGLVMLGGAAIAYRSGWGVPTPRILRQTGPTPVESFPLESGPSSAASDPDRHEPVTDQGPRHATKVAGSDDWGSLLEQLLRLWGITDDVPRSVREAGPGVLTGQSRVSAIASRYQLSAILVPEMSVTDLRAVNLPAIVELGAPSARRPHLLKRLGRTTATLLSATAEEVQLSISELEKSRTRSAWVVWRNVDLLPADPSQDMTPVVVATLGLRLQKLGLLDSPIPTEDDERLREAVRRFQSSRGLAPDGFVGPRTTLALSRVVIGRVGPSLVDGSPSSN